MVDKEPGSKDVRIEPLVETTFRGVQVESKHMIVVRVFRRKKDGQVYCRPKMMRDDCASARRVRRVMLFWSRKKLGYCES